MMLTKKRKNKMEMMMTTQARKKKANHKILIPLLFKVLVKDCKTLPRIIPSELDTQDLQENLFQLENSSKR